MPPPAPRTVTLEACRTKYVSIEAQLIYIYIYIAVEALELIITYLAGGSGESPLLEEVKRLTSSEHCERWI